MSDGKKVRRLPWLRARFQPALKSEHRELLAQIAKSAPSPNAAYDQAYLETGDIELARACRWLAVTKRDHGTEALKTLLPPVKPRDSRSTSTSERNETMSTGTKPETKPEQPEVMENKIPTLPLRQINFRATVNGVFARVRCIQEFENDADHPVEAVYTFPLPDEATVTACQMRIGKRKVEAVLKERAEARKEYDEAILAGHHGALLEQQRPNIFTMNVGGIEPGEKINVEVDYVQRVPWQAGGGRFRIPLVVAPRFIPGVPTGKQGGGWAEDTDQVPDASKITPPVARGAVSYAADISVSLTPGFACRVESPSHPFAVETHTVRKNDNTEYKTGQIRPDRDFILTYQSTRGIPEVAAFTNTFGNEGFLLTQIIPGTVVPVASDIILLLDISGSMGGPKIDGLKVVAKKVLQKLIGQKTGHNVGIIAFESQPHLLQPLTEVSPVMEKVIDGLSDRGGTELGPALNLAFSQFRDSGRPKMILLVTDGQTESLVHIGTGARIIAAGIDTAVNDSTLKELARNTNGACEWFYPGEDFNAVANRLTGMLSGPVLRDVTVTSQGEAVGISDVFEGLPAAIAIRFSGKVGQAEIRGKTPDGKEASWTIMPKDASACDFCHQLWAREFIRQTAEAEKQVATSLKYGVICNRTSFVAISEKEVPGQKPERVEIPVELPHGWNFDSVFGAPFAGLARDIDDQCHYLVGESSVDDTFGATLLREGGHTRQHRPWAGMSKTQPPVLPTMPPVLPPTVPPAAPPVPRFSLEAKNLLDRLIGILIALNQGKRQEAEVAFQKLGITYALVKSWSEETRAIAFYFVTRLKTYGLRVDDRLFQRPISGPAKRQIVARSWHGLGMREFGVSFPLVEPPAGCDGYDYLLWKLGLGAKPVSEPWSLVP